MEEDKNGLGRRRANQRPKPSTQRKQTTASRQATNDNDTAAIMAGDITDVVGVGRERESWNDTRSCLSFEWAAGEAREMMEDPQKNKQTGSRSGRRAEKKKRHLMSGTEHQRSWWAENVSISPRPRKTKQIFWRRNVMAGRSGIDTKWWVIGSLNYVLTFSSQEISILASAKDQRSRLLARTESTSE